MKVMFRLPRSGIGVMLVVLLWWPLAATLVVAYWFYIGWWWHLLVIPSMRRKRPVAASAPGGRVSGGQGSLSPQAAEQYVTGVLRWMGEVSARTTTYSADGGLDAVGRHFAAQVKHYNGGSVGSPAVRQLIGAAMVAGRRPLFFTSGRYTRAAIEVADRGTVALFWYAPSGSGRVEAINSVAAWYVRNGLHCTAPQTCQCGD